MYAVCDRVNNTVIFGGDSKRAYIFSSLSQANKALASLLAKYPHRNLIVERVEIL